MIRAGESFVMEMKNTGLAGFVRSTFKATKTTKAVSKSGDPNDEFDTGHDLDDSKGLTPEQATALTRAHSIIVQQVEILRKERDPASRKPMFTDVEIGKEVLEPLIRRKIIPENAVTDQYSDVSRTFEAASAEYDTRLEAYTESLSSNEGLAAKLGLGSEFIDKAGSAGGKMLDFIKILPGMEKVPATEIKDVMMGITMTIKAPLDISASVLKNGFGAKSVEQIARSLTDVATGWVTTAFDIKFGGGGSQDKINKQLGAAINAGLKVGLSGTAFAAKIAKGEAKDAMADLGDVVEQCLVCAGSGSAYQKGVKDDGALAEAGRYIKAGLTQSGNIAAIVKALDAEDPAVEIGKILQEMVKDGIALAAKAYQEKRKEELEAAKGKDGEDEDDGGEDDEEDKEDSSGDTGAVAELLKLAQTKSKEELEKLFCEDEALKANKKLQELVLKIAEKKETDIKAAADQLEEEMAKDQAAFNALLSGSESGEGDADIEAIETLILLIKRDQMIMKIAESLLKMPVAAVAAFFPPASIAADALQMATSLRKAIMHTIAWAEWNDNVTDAKSYMSVQVSAMANRAGISQGKAIRESVIVAEGALKLIGDVLATAGGPVAPVGVGLAKGVSALSSIKDIILMIYDEVELKRNWNKYKNALDRPDDRKAIRSAIRGNATLAKYVIAYGAVIAADPVAKNAMRKCGLSTKVMQSPNTNVQKVVSYLETVYNEDPVVLERIESPPKWHPGPILLAAASISSFSQAGTTKAQPPFAQPILPALIKDVRRLETALTGVTKLQRAWENLNGKLGEDEEETEEVRKARLDFVAQLLEVSMAAGAINGSLTSWQPQAANGKPHEDGMEYRKSLVRLQRRADANAKMSLRMYDDDDPL